MLAPPQDVVARTGNQGGDAMRRRWLLSIAICTVAMMGIRGLSARPAKAATITHVVELAGADFHADAGTAQYRYLQSQPHHWRQLVIKN
jgi:hypothetical protein